MPDSRSALADIILPDKGNLSALNIEGADKELEPSQVADLADRLTD